MEWIQNNWLIISAVIVNILNAATNLWHDHPKAVKWLTFFISVFSVVKSKNAEPGLLGAIKMPFVPEFKNKSVSKIVAPALMVLVLGGCKTVGGEQVFDTATALDAACNSEPAVNMLVDNLVCNNLKEPAKSTCLKVSAIAHALAPGVLAGIGAMHDACKGETPRDFPRKLDK